MAWVKIDDGMHAHRKTRRIIASSKQKRRDSAPLGLWLLAASWAAQNQTDGWVPEFEMDRWDDDWPELAAKLVNAGYWWPEQHEGEPGYSFVNWEEYNNAEKLASNSGRFGNHDRWHTRRGMVSEDCEFCPSEPISPDVTPDSDDPSGLIAPDIAPESHPNRGGESDLSLNPTPPHPNPTPLLPDADASSYTDPDQAEPDRFDEWWDAYGKKVGRKKAEHKWGVALKKKGINPDVLISATKKYIAHQRSIGKHPEFTKDPTTWLNGEHWNDELASTGDDIDTRSHPELDEHGRWKEPPPPRAELLERRPDIYGDVA